MSTAKATPEDVKRLAGLARVAVAESDLAGFAAEFDAVLAYVGRLDELTLPDQGAAAAPAVRNAFRADGAPTEGGAWTEKLAEQFPARDGDSLSVKQIITHD